jgi:hypothetical protein
MLSHGTIMASDHPTCSHLAAFVVLRFKVFFFFDFFFPEQAPHCSLLSWLLPWLSSNFAIVRAVTSVFAKFLT